MAARKRNPQDATLRNVRAAQAKLRHHAKRLLILENRMMHAEKLMTKLRLQPVKVVRVT